MAANIAALLDKAKVLHRLSSDYKLALVMGVKPTTLANYRNGKTLPDARVIGLICDLTGDDAAILAAEIEEQRANTDEARALWHQVAQRLQAAAATAVFAVAFVVAGWVGFPMGDALAKAQTDNFSSYTSWNVIRTDAPQQKRKTRLKVGLSWRVFWNVISPRRTPPHASS